MKVNAIKTFVIIVAGLVAIGMFTGPVPDETGNDCPTSGQVLYRVVEGDTSASIAAAHGMTRHELAVSNIWYVENNVSVNVGNVLCVNHSDGGVNVQASGPLLNAPSRESSEPHLTAYKAYVRAAETSSCRISPELLAAIGYVETIHGTFGGSVVEADGDASPRITGPQLNGLKFAEIGDTDGGQLDGDIEYDRAVGPMQFIPSSWELYGEGDPNNIFDAAEAATRHLCSTGGDSSNLVDDEGDIKNAVFGYNRSTEYYLDVKAAADFYTREGVLDEIN